MRAIAKIIQTLIPPIRGKGVVVNLLQKIRKKSFYVVPDVLDGYYSQNGQDKYLVETLCRGKSGGFFLDIGANDGITGSNTFFLEKHLGWKGLCVEPQPDKFEVLRSNRQCVCLNGCVSEAPGEADFLQVRGSADMLSGLTRKYDPRHVERLERALLESGGSKHVLKTKCYTYRQIVDMYNITGIDYLSIDIEGGELDLLKSIDFDLIPISVISVENAYRDGAFELTMREKHYQLVAILGSDEFYVPCLRANETAEAPAGSK